MSNAFTLNAQTTIISFYYNQKDPKEGHLHCSIMDNIDISISYKTQTDYNLRHS